MSAISHLFVTEDEMRRAREIVERHKLPDFVSGFRIEFGEFYGDPAVWVLFETPKDVDPREIDASGRYSDRLQREVDEMIALERAVMSDLRDAFLDHTPYVRHILSTDNPSV